MTMNLHISEAYRHRAAYWTQMCMLLSDSGAGYGAAVQREFSQHAYWFFRREVCKITLSKRLHHTHTIVFPMHAGGSQLYHFNWVSLCVFELNWTIERDVPLYFCALDIHHLLDHIRTGCSQPFTVIQFISVKLRPASLLCHHALSLRLWVILKISLIALLCFSGTVSLARCVSWSDSISCPRLSPGVVMFWRPFRRHEWLRCLSGVFWPQANILNTVCAANVFQPSLSS